MKRIFLVIMSCLLVMALMTACAGSAKTTTTEQKTTTQTGTQNTAAATGDAKANLQTLISAKKAAVFKAEYNMNLDIESQTQTGGSIQQSMVGTQTLSQKGSNTKMEMATNFAGQLSITTIYNVDGETYTCAKMGEIYNCIKGDQTQGVAKKDPKEIEDNIAKYQVKSAPDKTVAGENTKCYKIYAGEAAYDDIVMTECFTNDGILAYTSINMQGYKYTLEAKSIARTVADSEFKVPVTG